MSAEVPPEAPVFAWMQWAAQHGVWDMISAVVIFLSALIGAKVLFWTKRRIPNLNFSIYHRRDQDDYPLKVYVEIRNYTGSTVAMFADHYVYRGGRAMQEIG